MRWAERVPGLGVGRPVCGDRLVGRQHATRGEKNRLRRVGGGGMWMSNASRGFGGRRKVKLMRGWVDAVQSVGRGRARGRGRRWQTSALDASWLSATASDTSAGVGFSSSSAGGVVEQVDGRDPSCPAASMSDASYGKGRCWRMRRPSRRCGCCRGGGRPSERRSQVFVACFFFRYSRTRRGGPEKGADGEVFEGRPPAWPHDKQGSNSVEGSLADNVRRGCPDEPRRKSPVDGASATDQVGGDAAADGSHKPGGNSICTRGAAEAIRRILAGGRPGPAQGWWIVRGIVCGSRGAGGEWEASRHVSVAGGGCRDDD
jgi:hypothetical protein